MRLAVKTLKSHVGESMKERWLKIYSNCKERQRGFIERRHHLFITERNRKHLDRYLQGFCFLRWYFEVNKIKGTFEVSQSGSNKLKNSARAVFLNRRVSARYRTLASIIPGSEKPEETTIRYKISSVQLITNLNVILYLSTCHTVYISVLVHFMIMP
jgi:hypothetical protein